MLCGVDRGKGKKNKQLTGLLANPGPRHYATLLNQRSRDYRFATQGGPNLVEVCLTMGELGPRFGSTQPNSAECGAISAEIGPESAKFRRLQGKLSRHRRKFGRFGPVRPISNKFAPNLVNFGHRSTDSYGSQTNAGRTRPNFSAFDRFGLVWPKCSIPRFAQPWFRNADCAV